MSVDKATVARVAHLARIGVEEAELDALAGELSNILEWVEQLNEVATDDVPPMASVNDQRLRWRADEVTEGDGQAEITANAPDGHDGYFAVPKVVE